MYEELKELYPAGPCNRTDPIVRHDSRYSASTVATLWKPQQETDIAIEGMPVDGVQMDGIYYPLIRINNHLLLQDSIIKFELCHDRFMPYMNLVFDDNFDSIEFSDMPGLNNSITVILLEPKPDAHRPIKLDFYITSCNVRDRRFFIEAEFKWLKLEKDVFKQLVFYYPSPGCNAKWCKLGPNKHPNTFELLHVIADECKLGFQATQKCRSIRDDRWRCVSQKNYKDVIQEAIQCGGLDEKSIFDAWIDTWGMLTMVNVPWVMDEEVLPDELSFHVMSEVPIKDHNTDSAKEVSKRVHRLLSNMTMVTGLRGCLLSDLRKLVDLQSGFYSGTQTNYTVMQPRGTKDADGEDGGNALATSQVKQKELSRSALDPDEYKFQKSVFRGHEMGQMTPTLKQRQIHDEYFKQQRTNMFHAILIEPNFGIERGMLVNILWYTNDTGQKATILTQMDNLTDEGPTPDRRDTRGDNWQAVQEPDSPVLDPALSGTYYVDGMKWTYTDSSQKMTQHLYLIKKGPVTQYLNDKSVVRFGVSRP